MEKAIGGGTAMRWGISVMRPLAIFLVIISPIMMARYGRADITSGGGKTAREIAEGPSVRFISDEEWEAFDRAREVFIEALKVGDVVFVAKLQRLHTMMGGGSIHRMPAPPITQVVFKDIEVLKGKDPKKDAFQFEAFSGEAFRFNRGSKVIAVLKEKKGFFSKEYRILVIAQAHKLNLDLAEIIIAQSEKKVAGDHSKNSEGRIQ